MCEHIKDDCDSYSKSWLTGFGVALSFSVLLDSCVGVVLFVGEASELGAEDSALFCCV